MKHQETISYKEIYMKNASEKEKERFKKVLKSDKGLATYHDKHPNKEYDWRNK